MKTCATCALWKPDRTIASLARTGGKCYYKGETRMAYKTLKMSELRPTQREERFDD